MPIISYPKNKLTSVSWEWPQIKWEMITSTSKGVEELRLYIINRQQILTRTQETLQPIHKQKDRQVTTQTEKL